MMSEQEALFQMATECAYARCTNRCKNQFGDMVCGSCKLYIANYSSADMQQLKLFMFSAEYGAARLARVVKRNKPLGRFKIWAKDLACRVAKVAIISAVVVGLVYTCLVHTPLGDPVETTSVEQPSSKPSTDIMIKDTLRQVERVWGKDVSGDGLVNCQDAAILFYRYYPDKSNCGIESNTKMVHAFNVVKIDGVWRAIEPQAYLRGERPKSYFMRDYWDNYDSAYNYDSWYKYGRYCE